MGNCCNPNKKQKPSAALPTAEPEMVKQKDESKKQLTAGRLILDVPKAINTENSRVDLQNKSIELLGLEHHLIYRNTKFSYVYTILDRQPLAKGTNGKLLLVQHNDSGINRAAKIVTTKISQTEKDAIVYKFQELRKLEHPNLIQIFDYFQDQQHMYLVMEFCEGGNLVDRINYVRQYKTVTLINIPLIFQQILSALHYLHKNKLLHRNLHPQKILFSSKEGPLLKLNDYGALTLNLFDESDFVIDKSYMPPEFLKTGEYTAAGDIWSCGVMLSQLLTGHHPFKEEEPQRTKRNIMRGTYRQGFEWDKIPLSASKLIKEMLSYNPKQRPTAQKCLKYEYLKSKNSKSGSIVTAVALKQLTKFSNESKLRQILLSVIVDRMMTQKERDDLSMLFQQIDANKDGRISKVELKEFLSTCLKPEQVDEAVDKLLHSIDMNSNGYLEFNEFLIAACDQKNILCKKNLERFFNTIDRDKSHKINAKELSSLFCNTTFTKEHWKELLKEGDINNDGQLSREEFLDLMAPQSSPPKKKVS